MSRIARSIGLKNLISKQDIRYTFLTDGGSDRALQPIIDWSLRQDRRVGSIAGRWANLSYLREQPNGLSERIKRSITDYPCNLLIIHRDAEISPLQQRYDEIRQALKNSCSGELLDSCVALIPVRMMEAWLLLSERAIRQAVGRPTGRVVLDFPRVNRLESLPNPKQLLEELLTTAAEGTARQRRRLHLSRLVHTVADRIEDFSPLEGLSSYVFFKEQLDAAVAALARKQQL